MEIATGTFGPYDITTLRELVHHLPDYPECDSIYVEDVRALTPDTLAFVAKGEASIDGDLHFRFLSEISDAREVVEMAQPKNEDDFKRLFEQIEEWGA